MIHFHCYKSHYLEPLYRCGVPLFYTISGFFLYASREDRQKEKIKKGIVKIIKLIFFFNVIYYLLYWFTNRESRINDINGIIRLVVYGDSISGHLWFLTSYFWTLIFILVCKYLRIKDVILYLISIICLIEGLMEGQYSFIFFNENYFSIQEYYLPWFTSSLPMMMTGYFIKKHETSIVSWMNQHTKTILNATCFFILLPYAEHRILCMTHHYSGTFMISTFPSVIMMFAYCVNHPESGKGTFVTTIGKDHSGNIYYWQFFPYDLFIVYIFSYDLLQNIGLLIMIIILFVWSYGINQCTKVLHRYKFIL